MLIKRTSHKDLVVHCDSTPTQKASENKRIGFVALNRLTENKIFKQEMNELLLAKRAVPTPHIVTDNKAVMYAVNKRYTRTVGSMRQLFNYVCTFPISTSP
jgi:indole-3-glycerol phosphate synthase